MKTLLITFLLLFSTVGICQTDIIHPIDESNVLFNPYSVNCGEDGLDWENYPDATGYDCPLDADYYSDTLHVYPGNILTSITFHLDEFHCRVDSLIGEGGGGDPGNGGRWTFHDYLWNSDDGDLIDDLSWMPGVEIIDLSNNETVDYFRRYSIVDGFDSTYFTVNLDISPALEEGEYEVRIVHEVPDNMGLSNDDIYIYVPNIGVDDEIFRWYNMERVYDSFIPDSKAIAGPYTEGPEIVLNSIQYSFEHAEFEWSGDVVNECDSTDFVITAPCNPDLTYTWIKHFDVGGAITLPGETCEHIPPSILETGTHLYEVSAATDSGEVMFSNFITVEVNPNPHWNYYHIGTTLNGAEDVCPLFFQVHIDPLDSLQGLSTTYEWSSDTINYAELSFWNPGENGTNIGFCFNPFIENDTIGVFYVEATNAYGCTTLDTAYVVFLGGDSVVFKNSLLPPGTTNIEEQVQHQAKLYPNPTNSQITVEHDFVGAVRFEIHDLSGRLVRQTQAVGRLEMDVSDLPQGVYIAVIGDGENRVVNRLVKW